MSNIVDTLNILLPGMYFMAFLAYVANFFSDIKRLENGKRIFLFITLILHAIYLLNRLIAFSHPPITNVFEIMTVLAFCIAFSYFILELVTDIRGTGLFIIIISFAFQLVSSMFIQDTLAVKEVLKSNLLGSHVLTALCGYSSIAISAVYGFLYLLLYRELKSSSFGLIFQRLPNLETLEKLSFYSAVFGFAMLSIAIGIGGIWLPRAFQHFSYADPKLITTAIVWLLYGLGIFFKLSGRLQGKKIMVLSIIGFLIAVFSTLVTNFLAKSFHSFY
jgi:ABC-type transport system involved in cytochrome c biogenesis permease subunit